MTARTPPSSADTFDTPAAITRSMLAWGVVSGPLYFAAGLTLAFTRDGFDLGRHPLSLLMLGDGGWMQRANLALSGALVLVAAIGARRAAHYVAGLRAVPLLMATVGVGFLGSAAFPPDPMDGFPVDAAAVVSASGILHLVFGLIAFGSAGAAALAFRRPWSRALGFVVLLAFLVGAALAQSALGVALLWLAVLATYTWLAAASIALYREVPHPDGAAG